MTIGLVLTDPLGKSWVSGLIALALGAGFFDLAAVFVVVMSLAYGDWPPTIINLGVFPAAGAALGGADHLWLARRRAFMRQAALETGPRGASAVGCWSRSACCCWWWRL